MVEKAVAEMRWRKLLVQVAIAAAVWSAFLLAAALWWAGESAFERLRETGWELSLAAFALFVANHLFRFVRWHWMLAAEGYAVPVLRSLSIFLAGLALMPTPAKAGVTVRSLLLLREGVPASASLAAWFAERVFDLLGLVVLAALLLGNGSIAGRWLLALGAGLAGVIAIRLAPRILAFAARRVDSEATTGRILDWSARLAAHAAKLVSGKLFVPYLLLGMAANAATGVLLWAAASRFGSVVAPVDAVGMVAVSQLSGSLSLLPGGLGGFELAMLGQLSVLGMPADSAIAVLALVRISTLWGSVAIGLPLLIAGMRRSEKSL